MQTSCNNNIKNPTLRIKKSEETGNSILLTRSHNTEITNFIEKEIGQIAPINIRITKELDSNLLKQKMIERLAHLEDHKGKDSLVTDILCLASYLFNQSQDKHIHINLETVTTNQCRLFHKDNLKNRLLCTYYGPGTQWINDAYVNREMLGKGDNNKIIKDFSKINQAGEFDILILRGELYSLESKGAVHRSPPIEDKKLKRLVLRIDDR